MGSHFLLRRAREPASESTVIHVIRDKEEKPNEKMEGDENNSDNIDIDSGLRT